MRRWLSITAVVALVVGLFVLVSGAPAHAAGPANDDFADAIDLGSSANGSTTGSNLDATAETGELVGGATIWWTWTAPADGQYLFDVCGSDFPAKVYVYEGESLASLSDAPGELPRYCWYGGDNWELRGSLFTATAGTTYHVQVSDLDGGAMGDVVLNWWQSAIPANDAFASAIELTGANGTQPGTIRFATPDTGQPSGLYDTVWYRWTAPATARYAFDTCDTTTDTKIGIYTGDTLGSLELAASGDDDCSYQAQAVLTAAEAVTYTVAVTGYNATYTGDFDLRWQEEAVPVNDAFADAVAITGASGTASGNNRFATGEVDEPAPYETVWWKWTAPDDGNVVFDSCASDTPIWLEAYAGTSLADLTDIAATHGMCYGPWSEGTIMMFPATAGTVYAIQAGNTYTGVIGGDIGLRWQMGAAPANDDIANAIELSGAGGTALGSNLLATTETAEPSHGLGTHSVWWTWTAPNTERVTFDTAGSKLNGSAIAVFAGTDVASLTPVASATINYGGDQALVAFDPVPGQTYLLGVGSPTDDMGNIVLHWPASEGYALAAPYVTADPSDQTVTTGTGASFSAAAGGNPPPTVQWQRSTDGGWTFTDLTGETGTTLTLSTTDPTMNGYQYRAVFTNSEASATTSPATLTVLFAPTVTTNPTNQTIAALTSASFTAAASGSPTPGVQWERSTDGGSTFAPISGATTTTYSFTTARSMDGYQYRAVFTNSQGSATTTAATLTVTPSAASVTSLWAGFNKGKITVTFSGVGDPTPTAYQCRMNVRNAAWVSCVSGDVFKSSAKTVSVHASNDGGTTWGPDTTVTVDKVH